MTTDVPCTLPTISSAGVHWLTLNTSFMFLCNDYDNLYALAD